MLLFCEKIAASADRGRAANLFRQLLCRIHASSIETFAEEKNVLLKGLRVVLVVFGPNEFLAMLSFLEDGRTQQRVRVLCVFADLNMNVARQALSDLARCLLSIIGEDVPDQSTLANFLERRYARSEHASLGEFSQTFGYLQTIMKPAASDGGASQQVAENLKDFEKKVEHKNLERKQKRAAVE